MPLKIEHRKTVVIHTVRDTCTVSLTEGETIRLDIGAVSLNPSEAAAFSAALEQALEELVPK